MASNTSKGGAEGGTSRSGMTTNEQVGRRSPMVKAGGRKKKKKGVLSC